jgi:hypothetical protein
LSDATPRARALHAGLHARPGSFTSRTEFVLGLLDRIDARDGSGAVRIDAQRDNLVRHFLFR